MDNPLEKFQELLRTLFQFDCADLDFGIYRIMKHKRDVIERFIAKDLPQAVAAELDRGSLADQSQASQELLEVAAQIKKFDPDGIDENGILAAAYAEKPLGKKYLSLKAKAATAGGREALEAGIYNHLYAFFSRYYLDGDFLSKRRYSKRERYAIPYNGEEVHVYWANHDQYYIKTAEYFTDYKFVAPNGVTVHFKLQAADVEQNNVKGNKRFFVPRLAEVSWDAAEQQLVIPFEWRPLTAQENIAHGQKDQQNRIVEQALIEIPKRLSPKSAGAALGALNAERRKTNDGDPVSYLEHHLRKYTHHNTADFFIHKDLRAFLSRELDFYLKNEVLGLDEMEASGEDRAEGWFQTMRVIRAVGGRIIEFLHQIEEFQKMLWEKRKFVTDTQYCITVGNIADELYPEIAGCDAQWDEWKELFHIDEEQAGIFGSSKSRKDKRLEFLRTHPTLVLDTRHFDQVYVDRLLASIDDVDEMTDELLIHSENWQALSLLRETLREKVKCIYIDPPYNTDSSSIPYKNDYKHSTYGSMMYDRLDGLRHVLSQDGAIFVSIDKTERMIVECVMDEVLGTENRIEELIWAMNTNNSQAPNYSTNHEYVKVYAKDRRNAEKDPDMFREPKPGLDEVAALVARLNPSFPSISTIESELRALYDSHRTEYRGEIEAQGLDWKDEKGNDPWKGLFNYKRAEYRDGKGTLVPEKYRKERGAQIWVWREDNMSMPATKQAASTRDPNDKNYRFYRPPHPLTGKPCPHPKSGWKYAFDDDTDSPDRRSFRSLDRDSRIVWGADERKVPQLKRFLHEVETNVAKSVFVDYSDGEKQTSAMFGRSGVFLAPKHSDFVKRFLQHATRANSVVVDCFGGSGSTAHAVIDLNRTDQGRRKCVIVEVADYFDSVLKPRVLKAVYSPEWRSGRPKRTATKAEAERSPRIIKVMRLESYEDALNNIGFDDASGQRAMQFDDYVLQYMLKWETRQSETLLNVEELASPFNYRLHIHANGQTAERLVDIPETFNYLLGLHVQTRCAYDDGGRRYLVYRGQVDHQRVAVIWRDTKNWNKADFERDKRFIAEMSLAEDADEVFLNGDSLVPGSRALEPVFKARMFAAVEA